MKIVCIGRNYAAHVEELGNDAPDEPLFFIKPDSAVLTAGEPFRIPSFSNDVHYELELVLRLGRSGKDIPVENALEHIDAFTLGLDMTARDVQSTLKASGKPWEKAKAFDGSAILSDMWKPWESFSLSKTRFELFLNGTKVQNGDPNLMLFPISQLIAHVSSCMTLYKGDLLFTGTPKGVGKTVSGDRLSAMLNGEQILSVAVE